MNYPLISDTWGKEEKKIINKVIKSGIYTYKGKYIEQFEKKFSRMFKIKYSVFVNSGSSANLISIASLFYKKKNPLKRGDEVIVPSLSWSTTYHPLQQFGLKLKIVDVNLKTLNMDAENVFKAVSKKTKLIIGVSILGNPIDSKKISEFCKIKKIYYMEDNCESMGAKIKKQFAGTFGIVNTHSSFFSHHISTIEGGIVSTNDFEIYNLLLSLRSHGWTRDMKKNFYLKKQQKKYEDYSFVLPGYNLRPTNISAAAGCEQLKKVKKFINIRKKNHQLFYNYFRKDPRFIIQERNFNNSSFSFTMIIKPKFLHLKNKIFEKLKKNNIEYRLITGGSFFKHNVKKYYNYIKFNGSKNANYLHENGFFVGNYPRNLKKEIRYLYHSLKNIL